MEQFENEIWKPTKENPIYLVSNKGRVKCLSYPVWNQHNQCYSIRKEHLMSQSNCNAKKYWRVGMRINGVTRKFAVHRLVAEAFIPNPENLPQVNHIDGNKDNNTVENLEWCTNLYNMHHAIEHGLNQTEKQRKLMSESTHLRKLTNEQVVFIKDMYHQIDTSIKGEKMRFCKDMQKLFHLNSENTIFWIIQGDTNKFSNQDIVQTTNYDNYLKEYKEIHEQSKPAKMIKDYAKELGINERAFRGRYRHFNKDINATIQYYKDKYHMQ